MAMPWPSPLLQWLPGRIWSQAGDPGQTVASILSKSHFCKEAAVKYDARLRERKYGVAEGKPLSDLKFMAKVSGEQCPYFTPAGGETLDEIKARGKDFFEYLCYLVAHEACLEKQTCPVAEESCFTSLTNYRDGLEDHADSDGTAEMLDASILVVSHGAFMRSWIDYLVSDLGCTLPSTLTKTELFSVSPNTGISRFIIKLDMREGIKPRIHCIYLNRVDHLHDKTADRI
ncbi:fructose-2,6-bisphosphatase TIGAR isoform X2 [Varanus komodoensis]|uniref:fructose-2,6-bisphosphatase TIGAR isoform X2 n=1 Tax=Varanus komodoensis TaxID=61221 RepID=UPI001CF78E0C|nr:fructose-2,6-bisphosphatase TIGAR isoform X2 [Varanus komodoensis]